MSATIETSHCVRPDHLGCNAEEDCHALRQCQARQNAGMPQTNAEKQKAFKQAMAEAGYVRLEAWVTREQREKFRQVGSDEWLRRKIDASKVKDAPER